jgi:hypothetical protein
MEKEVNVEKYVIFLLSTLSFGLVILFLLSLNQRNRLPVNCR